MVAPVDSAIVKLVDAGLVHPELLLGCSEQELVEIERACGMKLPLAYRGFLARMGKAAGQFLVGTDWKYPEVLGLRGQAEGLLLECGAPVSLGAGDLVFAVHQGYQFLFMRSEVGSDPPVFLYDEGESEFREVADSFSGWLLGCVADEIAAARALQS